LKNSISLIALAQFVWQQTNTRSFADRINTKMLYEILIYNFMESTTLGHSICALYSNGPQLFEITWNEFHKFLKN